MLRVAFALLLAACAPHPIVGSWAGNALPIALSTTLTFVAASQLSFTATDARIEATLSTESAVTLGTLVVKARYAIDARTVPEKMTLEIQSIVLAPLGGEPARIDEKNAAAGGTLLCFPLGNVEGCVAKKQTLELSVDGDTLRIFISDGEVARLAIVFQRKK